MTPQPDIERYRHAVPFRDLLSEFGYPVNGKRSHIPCFVHGDRNPSMKVYDDHCYCFSCGAHFDSIALVQRERSCDFWGALGWIAERSGLPAPKRDPEAQKVYENRKTVSEVYAAIFKDSLKLAAKGLQYLESRGIRRDIVEGSVGFLPADYKPGNWEEAKDAGLVSRSGNFLFADRLIIRIVHNGAVVCLYGRILGGDRKPVHIYPGAVDPRMPETLFGISECRNEKTAFLAESIIDCLTLRSHGFKALGCFGTQGLTEGRIAALKAAKVERVILCFDSDANCSGQKGALKAGEALFKAGLDVEIVSLPLDGKEKQDPNSFFMGHTAEDFRALERQEYFVARLEEIPRTGSTQEKFRRLKPVLELISSQPMPTWDAYCSQIVERFPTFKAHKLVNEIAKRSANRNEEKQGKFLPLAVATEILSGHPVIYTGGAFYRYDDGYYQHWYSEEIDSLITELIGPECQAHQLDSVQRFLKQSFVRPERINPPDQLNIRNGILDMKTGELLPHSSEYLHTVQAQVAYDKDATWPRWRDFLNRILPEEEKQVLLSEIFGYSLTSDISHHKAFVFYGEGANGKSVVCEILEALVGPDNCSALMLSDLREKFRVAELQHKMVNITEEVEAKTLIDDARFKKIVGGATQLAERKNSHPFNFNPHCKMIICCNSLPASRDKTYGYRRRFIILPFEVTIPEGEREPHLARDIIRDELSGILNWSLGGFKRLRENGRFTVPEASKKAMSEYQNFLDPKLQFMDEHIERDETTGSYLKDIYGAYSQWSKDNGFKPESSRVLREAIEKRFGIEGGKREHGKHLPHITLTGWTPSQDQA